jgi:hypothetical protein
MDPVPGCANAAAAVLLANKIKFPFSWGRRRRMCKGKGPPE